MASNRIEMPDGTVKMALVRTQGELSFIIHDRELLIVECYRKDKVWSRGPLNLKVYRVLGKGIVSLEVPND